MRNYYNGLKQALTPLAGAFALAALLAGCAHAPAAGDRNNVPPAREPPPTAIPLPAHGGPSHRRAAGKTIRQAKPLAAELRADAPPRYRVKAGDTLWGIAKTYLRDPRYWPRLWHANPRLADPNKIYPGEVLVLARAADGRPALRGLRVERLSPRVRTAPIAAAVPTIPYSAIRDFLVGPRLVGAATLNNAPYVVSFGEQHLAGSAGGRVYIRGADAGGPRRYAIVRAAGAYKDFKTGKILGQKALPVGQATLERFGAVATGYIDRSSREVLVGDRLLPIRSRALVRNFHPHAPAAPIAAHIISVYGGASEIGRYDVVTLDAGTAAGVARGDVLDVFKAGPTVADPIAGDSVALPAARAGRLMIFAAEKPVSFALVMQANRAIHLGDLARAP